MDFILVVFRKTMTILIGGATGNIGGEVVNRLLEKKLPLRAFVRDRHKASKLEAQGIEVDARDVAAVAAICLTESGHTNQSYVLTGSEAMTFDALA